MSKVKNYEECCESLQAATLHRAYGFDFTILLPLILDILMEVIGGCGDEDDVIEKIEKKSFTAKWAARKAIKQAAKDQGLRVKSSGVRSSSEDIINWASKNTDLIRSALKEVDKLERDAGFDGVWK